MEKDAYRKMKQKYLRQEIMENNFNPEEFSEFLETRKKNGEIKRNKYRFLEIRRIDKRGGEI
jgi:hypothetical protein